MNGIYNATIGALGTVIALSEGISEEVKVIILLLIQFTIITYGISMTIYSILSFIIKSYKKRKIKKCNNRYKEKNTNCKKCSYKEECKNGF